MKTYTVFEVIYHVPDDSPQAYGGAAGDGSFIERFRKEPEALRFAAGREYYGKPASLWRCEADHAPKRCGCDDSLAIAKRLEVCAEALEAIKLALASETVQLEASRVNWIGSIVALAEANLARLDQS